MTGQHRTMSPAELYASWEREGTSVQIVTLSGRPYAEVRSRSGRSICISITDAVDVAHAIDRAVTGYVESETGRIP